MRLASRGHAEYISSLFPISVPCEYAPHAKEAKILQSRKTLDRDFADGALTALLPFPHSATKASGIDPTRPVA